MPAYVAADLVAQAEHDPLAACLLVTDSVELLDAVDVELGKQVPATRHRERVEAALAGQSAHVLVDDLDHGLEVVDAWAAEHLEVVTVDAAERARRVRNAGAVFVGDYTPVCLGDYLAGSNHVLPTGGTARFTRGLSAQSFLKRMSVVEYSREALARSRRTSPRSAVPRTCGARRGRRRSASGERVTAGRLPVRDDLRGKTPYGAPQLARRDPAQRQREPAPAVGRARGGPAAAVGGRRGALNRYPDREAVALRTELAAYLSGRTGVAARRRAGLGGQRLQRGAAAGAAGLRRAGAHGAGLRAVVLHAPAAGGRHRHRVGRACSAPPTSR